MKYIKIQYKNGMGDGNRVRISSPHSGGASIGNGRDGRRIFDLWINSDGVSREVG